MTEHTPTPWFHRQAGETSKHGDAYDWIGDSPEHGRHRKIIVGRDSCDPADYAFICKAVNNHDALVKALAAMLDTFGGYCGVPACDGAIGVMQQLGCDRWSMQSQMDRVAGDVGGPGTP